MNYMEKLAIGATRMGPIPKHVAFIMDGNRRFAKRRGKPAPEGHFAGFSSLLRVLEWCMLAGVEVVTIYAFSIENFNRPKEEVETLMKLAEEKFQAFLKHEALVMRHEICVRILGDLSLLPQGVKRACARVMHGTKNFNKLTLNICFAYTSGEEIARTVRDTVAAARTGVLRKEDIDASFLNRCLYTRGSCPDLMIRTSGETRLSDFLAWQSNRSHLCFLDVTWPEIDVWRFITCIWDYQAHCLLRKDPKEIRFNDYELSLPEGKRMKAYKERRKRQKKYLRLLEERELAQCKEWMLDDDTQEQESNKEQQFVKDESIGIDSRHHQEEEEKVF